MKEETMSLSKEELEERLGAAYQIVGSMAEALGIMDKPNVQQALDYLSEQDVPNPLPFEVPIVQSSESMG